MSAGHDHAVPSHGRAFAIAVGVNLAFSAIEVTYGVISGSLALIADAGHNLSDVLGLLLAWGASVLATRPATERRTYGFRKASILGALGSSLLLLVAIGGMAWEAVGRIADPAPVEGLTVMVVAGIGVLVNAGTAALFMAGQRSDLNIRGAFLHLAADAAVSVGVVIAGAVIFYTGWLIIDPVMSLVVAIVILVGTWSLLRDSLDLAMDAVPKEIDLAEVRGYLEGLAEVRELHDLHVWPLSTTETALSVHLVLTPEADVEQGLDLAVRLQDLLHDRFEIAHATVQVERDSAEECRLRMGGSSDPASPERPEA
jgi:cobalt-zinc-cadmium efflux system protein